MRRFPLLGRDLRIGMYHMHIVSLAPGTTHG